jgi:hypothetical protein
VAVEDVPDWREARTSAPIAVVALLAVAVGFAVHASPSVHDSVQSLIRAMPLILVALVAVPVLIAIAARPQVGVLCVAALVPFNGLLIIAPAKPPFAEGWKEALALYTLGWAILSRVNKPRVRRSYPKFIGPLLCYLAVALVSAAVVGGIHGLEGVKVGFFWVLIGVTVWLAPFDARDRDRLVTLLMADAFLTSLYGLAQQKIGADRLVALGYSYDSNVRFTSSFVRSFSSFPNPFNFAFFLTIVLLIGIPICLDDVHRPRNIAFLTVTPIILLAQFFTFVRGAWIALGVGLLYLAFRRYRVLLLPVPVMLLVLLFLPGTFSSASLQGQSFNERQLGWSQNVEKVVSAPLGNGIGTTGASAEKAVAVARDTTAIVYQPDNQYFKVLFELGVIGLWFFLLMFVMMVFGARRAERLVARGDRAFAMGVTANVLGAMVASVVATWMEIFPNDLFLWLLLSVIITATHESS